MPQPPCCCTMVFLSTPSARRATGRAGRADAHHSISIHALREEGDYGRDYYSYEGYISIHALREEGDPAGMLMVSVSLAFLSTPSARRATAKTEKNISAFVLL